MIDNVGDTIKCLYLCDERKVVLLRFVIFELDEVAVVPGEATATLTQKINELCLSLNHLVDSEMLGANLGLSHNRSSQASNPTYTVLLKSPPKILDDPVSRKDFLSKMCGNSSDRIIALKPRKDAWRLILSDKDAAQLVAQGLNDHDQSLNAKVKNPSYFGIVHRIPEIPTSDDLIQLVANCSEAK